MVRTVVIAVFVVICIFGVNGMPGKRVGRGFNTSGYGSERRGGGGYNNHGNDERDASVSSETGCSGENYESRESTYGREDSNSNERRYGGPL